MAKKSLGEELVKRSYDIILVDGMNVSVIHFYSKRMLSYRGKLTGMLYGVMRLVKSLQEIHPTTPVMFLWEGPKKDSIRKGLYKSYKSNRETEPQEGFLESLCDVKKALALAGVEQVYQVGLEADDLAGYYSKRSDRALLVSSDKDWWQFARSGAVDIMNRNKVYTYEQLQAELGFPPEKLPLFKILKGDSSDCVPGIPRFPTKLAVEVIQKCDCADEIFERVFQLNRRWATVCLEHQDEYDRNVDLVVYHDSWVSPSKMVRTCANKDPKELASFLESRGIKSLTQGWLDK